MPVSPKEAAKNITTAEERMYKDVVTALDEQLPRLYQGHGEVEVKIPTGPGLTSRLIDRLRAEYQKVGWKLFIVDRNKGTATLSEKERDYDNAWGR